MDTDASNDSSIDCKSPSIVESVQNTSVNVLASKKSLQRGIKSSFSENILMTYFGELSKKKKPTSLWTQYSMLRSTLSVHHDVDISKYLRLKALLKRKSLGYKPKRSKTLTSLEINRFLNEAPDEKYLFTKVALVIGINGACSRQELCKLKINDVEDLGSAALIKIPDARTKKTRMFTITGEFYEIYKKYATLRPSNAYERRFFLNYQNGKCTVQPVGGCGLNPLDHAVAVDDARTTGTQDIYPETEQQDPEDKKNNPVAEPSTHRNLKDAQDTICTPQPHLPHLVYKFLFHLA
ncbi:hypothetical protein GEV33_008913 [Tenebrio molitor]|uniref:Uncharacterized protein n=1 Tax=Tenebrio molitor TaxID=7067 RepID=A0A8J6LBX5_TENMO|nr:hypothetical protein GEV33_008913 [Tenebrio molitor]